MKRFTSIAKIDDGILYVLELASSLSIILLAFGLIASMANVLTKGGVLSDSPFMQALWAWTQCIAIDASVAGTIIRVFEYKALRQYGRMVLYAFLSCFLLFTAAIVSNIESVQQTLNLTLDNAYGHIFIPLEGLIWMRSVSIVLLIVCHALRHVQTGEGQVQQQQQMVPAVSPELLEKLRVLLSTTNVSEEQEARSLLTEIAPAKVEQHVPPAAMSPGVTLEESNKVIEAYQQGIQRRKICSYLHWGSAKYTTIVKPVLDAYEQWEQQMGVGE